MRNHSKKLLSFILAVLVLLGSMPLALTAFAEGEIVLELNKGTLVDSTYVPTAGAALPTYDEITREGWTFGGWYDNSIFEGTQHFSAAAGETYYARWIANEVAVDFESYTPSTFIAEHNNAGGANNFHFFHHATDSSAELNISSSNAKSGNNSAKINLKRCDNEGEFVEFGAISNNWWWSGDDEIKEGFCFWISTTSTINIEFETYWTARSPVVTVPAGRHIITLPKTSGVTISCRINFHGKSQDAEVYIDDIGTFTDAPYESTIDFELNGGAFDKTYNLKEGDSLPTYENVTKEGYTFGGWFREADFSGDQQFTAAEKTTYYARWIKHVINAVDFESYNNSNFSLGTSESNAFRVWTSNGSSVSLNTDKNYAYDGNNSVAICNSTNSYGSNRCVDFGTPGNAASTGKLWWDSTDDIMDGFCFWISVSDTVTFEFQNQWSTIAKITLPKGKHIIAIPKGTSTGYLVDSKFIFHTGNGVKIYLDAIGTYEEEVERGITFKTNGGTWTQGYTAPTEYTREGLALPTYDNITKNGAVFAGWYENFDFSGERAYSIATGAKGNKTYYAHWITTATLLTDVEKYNSTAELTAGTGAFYFWPGITGVTAELNTSSDYAYSGNKSAKIALTTKSSTDTYDDVHFGPQISWYGAGDIGEGISFWICTDTTVKFKLYLSMSESSQSPIITVPAGKHFITVPWADVNNDTTAWITLFRFAGQNATVYFDDIAAYKTAIPFNTNGGKWVEGFTAPTKITPGEVLPTYENITKENATFAGWYRQADFSGERIYTVPADAQEDDVYYAYWIRHTVDATDFEDDDAASFADKYYFWPNITGSSVALNTNAAYANSGTKSAKITVRAKSEEYYNTDFGNSIDYGYGWWPADQYLGDGICFWISTDKALTFKIYSDGHALSEESIYVPAGKHFITVPKDVFGNRRKYFWIRFNNPDEGATVYIDDIGTYFGFNSKANIIYDVNDGYFTDATPPALQTSSTSSTVLPTAEQMKKEGYYFAGWYDNAELSGNPIFYLPAGSYNNKQLWARWVEQVEINYDFEDASNAQALTNDGWKDATVYEDTRPNGGGFSVITVETNGDNVASGHNSLRGEYQVYAGGYTNYDAGPNAVFRRFVSENTFSSHGTERDGDGFCFWVKSDRELTMNVGFFVRSDARLERQSSMVNIPAGTGVRVYLPWSEFSEEDTPLTTVGFKFFEEIGTTGKIWIDDLGIYYNEKRVPYAASNTDGDIKVTGFNNYIPKTTETEITKYNASDLQKMGATLPQGASIAYLAKYNLKNTEGKLVKLSGPAWVSFKIPAAANTSKLGAYRVFFDGSLIPVNYTFVNGWIKVSTLNATDTLLITLNDSSWTAKGPAISENVIQDVSGSKTFDVSKTPLKRGINFGNANTEYGISYESYMFEEKYYFEIREKGFDHLRIDINFFAQMNDNYNIDEEFFCQVDTIINLALNANLKVVLDGYHFSGSLQQNVSGNLDKYYSMWRQIAARYQKYPSGLVFELINEPMNSAERNKGGPDVILPEDVKALEKQAISIIRQNNPTRLIVYATPYNADSNELAEAEATAEVKNDKNIVITFHNYTPGNFTHQGASWSGYDNPVGGQNFTEEYKQAVLASYDAVKDYQNTYGRPIWVGEFGAMYNQTPAGERAKYAATSIQALKAANLGWCWFNFDSNFGIYDFSADNWMEDGTVDALVAEPSQGVSAPSVAGLFTLNTKGNNSSIENIEEKSAVYTVNGVEYSAIRTFGEYIAPDNGYGAPDLTKIVIYNDGTNKTVKNIKSRHVLLGFDRYYEPTIEKNYKKSSASGDKLNTCWSVTDNGDGTWTVRFSLLLKNIPKSYRTTEFSTRTAIVYDGGTLYSDTLKAGISAQKIYDLTEGYSWYK